MKKLLVFTLTLAMCLSLVACSSGTPTSNGGGDSKAAWPGSTVTVYVPASAGGGTDTLTRILTSGLAEVTGANFPVSNDATGNGTVAAETVRNAAPDGQTLFAYHTAFCGLIASGQYSHTLDDFTFVGVFTTPGVESDGLFVPADSPFETLDELVAYAKEHPGELISGAQSGQTDHFEQVLLNRELGVDITVVDCGGNAEKIPALMGHSIDMAIIASVNSADYVASGDLRCLTTLGENQSQVFPDVPTLGACGYKAVGLPAVCFLLGPKNIPQETVDQINEYLKVVSESDTVKEQLAGFGTEWKYMSAKDGYELVSNIQELYTAAAPLVFG